MIRRTVALWGGVSGVSVALIGAALFSSCAEDSADESESRTYATSGTTGDYADWTIAGDTLSAEWKVINSTGGVDRTLSIQATCGTAEATYGYRECTIDSASCVDGASVCSSDAAPPAGFGFYVFEVPGVALMVKGKGQDQQLHVGLLKDTSCDSVAGDYTFINTGVLRRDIFGIYRTDADVNSVVHADFGFSNSGTASATPSLTYTTGGGSSSGAETMTGSGCVDGVRERVLSGSTTVRMAATPSGAFILDLPSGMGGMVAFKTSLAAQLADFANKTFVGIQFPDNATESLMVVTTGANSGGEVPVSSISMSSQSVVQTNPGLSFKVASGSSWSASSPAFANFGNTPSAYTSLNALASTYSTVGSIPGLFVVDGTGYGDSGRVVIIAMKSNDQVVLFGSVFNHRSTDSQGNSLNDLANTGAFMLFEKQ